MAKINQDFTLYTGEDKQINFTITDENDNPVDLTNSEAVWVVVRQSSSDQILITKKVSTGGIIINNNVYQVILNYEDTDILNGKYRHELRMINSDLQESVLATGKLQVYNSFTKDL